MKVIKLNAPIVPWKGMGGIKLYTHISDLFNLIEQAEEPLPAGNYLMRYEIKDSVYLWFNIVNGKLFKITALKNYTGSLFGKIKVGMDIDEVLKLEPSFVYEDFEEVYCSPKGIFIETDPVEHTVLWISVYIKELDYDDDDDEGYEHFIRGNW